MVDQSHLLRNVRTAYHFAWFPKWALDEDASVITKALVDELQQENKPLWWASPCVTGPATLYAFKANAFTWFSFLCYPLIGLAGTSCSGHVAVYRPWVWLPFFPMMAASLYFEFRCATYIMPFHIMVAKCKVLGVRLSFNGWLALTAALSLVSYTEYVTASLFLVKTFKTSQCDEGLTNLIWQQVLEESAVPFLSGITLPTFALVLWSLMIVQLVYALAASIPISANLNKQACHASIDYKLKSNTADRVVYNTLLGTGRHHNEVLVPLAEAARMNMPTYMNASFLACVWPSTSSQRICDDMQQQIVKFGAFILLHSALQPNLQTTSLALTKAAEAKDIDEQTVFSSCMSLLVALKALYTDWQYVHLAWRMVKQRDSATNHLVKRRACKLFGIFCMMVALYLFLILYAAIKLYMARWGCAQGVWNIGACVEVHVRRH